MNDAVDLATRWNRNPLNPLSLFKVGRLDETYMTVVRDERPRQSPKVDVLIVGEGTAGLAAAWSAAKTLLILQTTWATFCSTRGGSSGHPGRYCFT
jgi:hypothetical protein